MRSRIKLILGIVTALVLSFITLVYVLLARYDCNYLKPLISKATMDATGIELTIDGGINLDMGFRPTIVLTDIGFQNASWGSRPDLLKIRRFEVQVALLPLITGRIIIKRCVVFEPNILLETDKSGNLNIDIASLASKIKLPAFAIYNMDIIKGQFSFNNGESGRVYKVSLNTFSAKAHGFHDPVEITAIGNIDREAFQFSATLGPIVYMINPEKKYPVDLTLEAFDTIARMKGTIKDPLHQRGLDLGFTLKARDVTKLAQLAGKRFPIRESLLISGYISNVEAKKYKVTGCELSLGSNKIRSSINLDLSDKTPVFSSDISAETLDLRQPLSQLKNGAPAGEELPAPEKKAGKLFSSMPLPIDALRRLDGTAKIRIGKLLSQLKNGTPTGEELPVPEKKTGKLFSSMPLPIDALTTLDGTAKIRIRKLLLPGLTLSNISTVTVLKNDTLIAKPIKATIGCGSLDGHINLDILGDDAIMNTQFQAGGVALGSMLKDLGIKEVMEGDFNVDIMLNGQGGSVAGIMENLEGHISITMTDGQILNRYIELLGTDLSASVYRLLNPFKKKDTHTDIRCMASRFDIENGVAESSVLVLDTEHMCVIGSGELNLRQESLNMSITPLPKDGFGTKATGKYSLNLGLLTRPFKLGGTLSKPSLTLDRKKTAITVGKALGGIALFGPFGIAAALIGKSAGDQNPCLSAIETAKLGVDTSHGEEPEEDEGIVKGFSDDIKGVGESIKTSFKNLFSK